VILLYFYEYDDHNRWAGVLSELLYLQFKYRAIALPGLSGMVSIAVSGGAKRLCFVLALQSPSIRDDPLSVQSINHASRVQSPDRAQHQVHPDGAVIESPNTVDSLLSQSLWETLIVG